MTEAHKEKGIAAAMTTLECNDKADDEIFDNAVIGNKTWIAQNTRHNPYSRGILLPEAENIEEDAVGAENDGCLQEPQRRSYTSQNARQKGNHE